jgi:hypothetical protein
MAGGLMQLVAYGAQDVYLTGNPKVTFFQAVYRNHTNFAMENIEQTVNGTAASDGRLSVTIARNGDLIGEMYLQLSTVALSARAGDRNVIDGCWAAERAIKAVELTIGGQRIDRHYQRWWRLYSELYLNDSKKANWAKLTTANSFGAAQTGNVYLPLIFFFNRNPGLYLPLIALQYHEVRLDFDLAFNYTAYFGSSAPRVWGNYVFLDTEERRRFAQKPHEYLIEQLQHTGADSLTANGNTKQVRLSYNHPVKELIWCVSGTDTSNAFLWNFTSNANLSNSLVLSSTSNLLQTFGTSSFNNVATITSFTQSSGVPLFVSGNVFTAGAGTGCTSLCSWAEEPAVSANVAVGPVETFKVILNGQDRFKEQPGKFFNQIQPYWHHAGTPSPGIYCYSFALKPEEHQPTGTCNFSRIDNAQVEVKMKSGTVSDLSSLYMFAVNYNVLRIQSGMGGLAFSN